MASMHIKKVNINARFQLVMSLVALGLETDELNAILEHYLDHKLYFFEQELYRHFHRTIVLPYNTVYPVQSETAWAN